MSRLEDSRLIQFLSQENEMLKAKLSNSINFGKQTSWDEKRDELEKTIQLKDEELRQKEEAIQKLQKRMDRMQLKSQQVEVPACHICEFEYDTRRVPKVLPCGHTLCVECLKRLDKIWSIICPYCRTEKVYDQPNLLHGPSTIPTNFTLVEVIETQKKNSSYSDTIVHGLFLTLVAPVTILYLVLKNRA